MRTPSTRFPEADFSPSERKAVIRFKDHKGRSWLITEKSDSADVLERDSVETVMKRSPIEAQGEPGFPCVILAGGRAKPELAAAIGTSCRALAEVRGKTLLRHVVDALKQANHDHEILAIGDLPASPDYRLLPDSGDFVSNVLAGANAFREREFLLYATADLSFLTGEAVREFCVKGLALAVKTDAQVVFPIVPAASCYRKFPGIKRTAVKLLEGEFTGGNLMLVRPAYLLGRSVRLKQLYDARKSPLKLASMLGFPTLMRLAHSRVSSSATLSLPFLEGAASRMIGGEAKALILDLPEIATDLDRVSDFEAVRNMTP